MKILPFFRKAAFFMAALAAVASPAPAQQPVSSSRQTVLTMREDYTITPAGKLDDGKHYKLNHLAKDRSVYESIDLTKVSEKDGAIVYSGANGIYTRLSEGTVEEPLAPRTTPVPTVRAVETPLSLMRDLPVAPVARGLNPTRLDSIVLPDGMTASRLEAVEGKPVLLLVTGIDNGKPHEVAVMRAGIRSGEAFYVRISNPTRASEPLVFGVINDRTVTGYAELPQGIPQIAATRMEQHAQPAVPVEGATQDGPPRLSQAKPASPSQRVVLSVHYQGRDGAIFTQRTGEGKSRTLLAFAGDGDSLEIEPLRGSGSVYTLAARPEIEIHVTGQGNLAVTDSNGVATTLPPADVRQVGISAAELRNVSTRQTQLASQAPSPGGATSAPGPMGRVATSSFPRSFYEPPVEIMNPDGSRRLGPDGKRRFELRLHNSGDGIDNMVTVTPTRGQEGLEQPSIFYLEQRRSDGSLFKSITYTVLPAEQGGLLIITTSFPPETATATTGQPGASAPSAGSYISDNYPVHADFLNNSQYIYYLSLGEGNARRVIQVFPRLNDSGPTESALVKFGRKVSAAGDNPYAYMGLPNMNYAEIREGGKKNGPHGWVDWQSVTSSSPTYFKLVRGSKTSDGPWEVKVSKEPFPLLHPGKH